MTRVRGCPPCARRQSSRSLWASGAGHQVLLVVPSLNLICVRNGAALADTKSEEQYQSAKGKYLFEPLMAAVVVCSN